MENKKFLSVYVPWVNGVKKLSNVRSFIKAREFDKKRTGALTYLIFYNGKICGSIGMHSHDLANKKVELGYWLGEKYTGRGIMTKTCGSIVSYCFNSMDIHRIEIRCAVPNVKSCAIPERLEFTLEGVFKECEWIEDHFVDHNCYAKLKSYG